MVRALIGRLGPLGLGLDGEPLGRMGRALLGPLQGLIINPTPEGV